MRRIPILLLIFAMLISSCGLFSPTDPGSNGTPTLPDPVQTTESAPDPDAAAQHFLDTWKAGDYAGMYALLSPLTQDGLSEEDFTNRVQEIMRGGAFVDVDFQIVSALVHSPQRAEVRYHIILTSAAVGEISRETRMDLTRSAGEDWRVAWTDAMILPELEGGNGLSLTSVTPTRANIYDKYNQAFAAQAGAGQDNGAALWIVPNEIGDEDAEETMLSTLRRLFVLATVDPILERYDANRDTDWFTPLGVAAYEDYNTVGGLLESVGGVRVRTYSTRYYYGGGLTPFAGGASPHAVGFVSQIQEAEYEDRLALGYQGDEFVGRIGIEAAFEDELRGVPGGTLYLVDPNGQVMQVMASRDPGLPYAVYTTLDRDLQEIAQRSIEGFQGAVVVLERDTGAVLAMASSPAFDPNLFDAQNPNGAKGGYQMLNTANQPYINRATQGLYVPGSVFKVVTMAAALETEYYEPGTIYDCGLEFHELPGWVGYDWRVDKELPAAGELTLQGGLEKSCNPWFYHIGLDLYVKGLPSAIPDMAAAFGLGELTGIEIGEDAGQVPSPENSTETLGEEWEARHPVQLAIGQSALLVTPLQVARYAAAIGNGGTLYRPQLVLAIENAEGDVLHEFVPDPAAQLPVSPENIAAIQEAMVNVVEKSGATAYRKFLGLNLNVAGKTGTASTDGAGDPHAWFTGYSYEGREDKPDIAIAVILENQGEGSDWAAPVFRRIVETYFKGRPLTLYPWESRIWVERTPEPDEEAEETPAP